MVAPVITQQPTNIARYASMTGSVAVASISRVTPWFQWQQQAQPKDWPNLAGGYDSILSFSVDNFDEHGDISCGGEEPGGNCGEQQRGCYGA